MAINFSLFDDELKYSSTKFVKKHFPHFLKKIKDEKQIKETKKIECLECICNIPPSSKVVDFENECNKNYFFKNKLLGKKCREINRKNPFVRATDKAGFIQRIASLIPIDDYELGIFIDKVLKERNISDKLMLWKVMLNNRVKEDSYKIEGNCISFFGKRVLKDLVSPVLGDAHTSHFMGIEWSFPLPKKENVFENNKTINKIPCRAGLIKTNNKVIFVHMLNDKYQVKVPTIFDGGFYPQFEPGGKTKPLSKCKKLSGFDEYVHKPNNYININYNITETST